MAISLYQYLVDKLKYTEAEAEETVLRYENGMHIPREVKFDIDGYWKQIYTPKKCSRIFPYV